MKSIRFSTLLIVIPLIGLFVACPNILAQGNYGYILSGSNSYSFTQFDLTTKAYSGSISLSDYSYTGALNQRGTKLWITGYSTLSVINTATKVVVSQQSLSSSSYTTSQPVFSLDGSKVYMLNSSSPSSIVERDTTTYQVTVSHQIQNSYNANSPLVRSKNGKKLYFIDNSNYLYEVNTTTWMNNRVSISYSCNRLKLSPNDSLLFMWGTGSNYIQVYNTSSLTAAGTIQTNTSMSSLDFSHDGSTLFVGFQYSSYIQIFNISQFPIVSSTFATLPNYSYDIACDPNSDSLLYIIHNTYNTDNVSIYNIHLGKVTKTFSTNNYPYALVMPMAKDNIAPSSITNLEAGSLNYDRVRLTFTTPGDDGISGRASFYDVRYDTAQISEANFKQATQLSNVNAPKIAGAIDTIEIAGLQGMTKYYFAIKAGDEVLNLSPLATVSITTPAPPRLRYQLDTIARVVKDNDSLSLTLKIQNNGDADLHVKVSLFNLSRQESNGSPSASLDLSDCSPSVLQKANRSTLASSTGYKVLLLYADGSSYVNDVRQKLLLQKGFATIDVFDASSSIPSLELLKEYDVVFVWSNNSFYNTTSLGNLLADYIDGRGHVVTAMFALSNNSYYSIQGRFSADNYWAITPGVASTNSRATLGTIAKPNHPIMKDVQSFDGGSYSVRIVNGSISTGATLIASWSDGSPLIATKNFKGNNRVDLNFYPASSDVYSGLWVSTTDGAIIMANALKYAAGAKYNVSGEITVSCIPDSGSIKSGATQNVAVVLKTLNALSGNYSMTIGIESNDPDSSFGYSTVNFTVRDETAPKVAIRFFQNEAFTQNLSTVSVAHEKLYSPVMKLSVGGDSTQATLTLLDTLNFVYNSIYKIQKSGTLSATLQALDSVGNQSVTTRQAAVLNVSPGTIAKIQSIDGFAQVELLQYSVDKNLCILSDIDEEHTISDQGDAVGSVYHFAPQSLQLIQPALLKITYPKLSTNGMSKHYGIFTKTTDGQWKYIPTKDDAEHQALYASINTLGDFRIINSPSIQPEQYIQEVPISYELSQNYPNPFNPTTIISYQLPVNGRVSVKVFNMLGQQVATLVDEVKPAGRFSISFDGAGLASGVYIYKITANSFTMSKKMLLTK